MKKFKSKIAPFLASLFVCTFLFCALFLGGIYLSQEDAEIKAEAEVTKEKAKETRTVTVFIEDTEIAANVNFDFFSGEITVVFAHESDFAEKFIKFTGKNFVTFADKSGGMVYSSNEGENLRLTGSQIYENLTNELFCEFIRQTLSSVSNGEDLLSKYYYVANNLETNVSYMDFYDFYHSF